MKAQTLKTFTWCYWIVGAIISFILGAIYKVPGEYLVGEPKYNITLVIICLGSIFFTGLILYIFATIIENQEIMLNGFQAVYDESHKTENEVCNRANAASEKTQDGWRCKKCGKINSNSSTVCKDCGAYK